MKNFDVILLRSFFSDSANKAHINKSNNNNVYQFGENKNQNSDNILAEIHANFRKHANEMKGNMYGENMFQCILQYILLCILSNSLATAIRKMC